MPLHLRKRSLALGLLGYGMVICLLLTFSTSRADEPVTIQITPAATAPAEISATASNETARLVALQMETLLQLQMQQRTTVEALDQIRKDVAASLAANQSNNLVHFAAMTESLSKQRAQDVSVIRNSNRTLLAIIIGFSAWMLLSILFLNIASIRAMNRLTQVFSTSALLPGTEAQALADARAASRQLLLFPGEEGTRQLGNAVMQLHSRIQEIEFSIRKARSAPPPANRPSDSAEPGGTTNIPSPSPAS